MKDSKSRQCSKQLALRVYVLSGASNRGKTTTLNKLAEALDSDLNWHKILGPNPKGRGKHDAQYVFEDKVGRRVGVSTAGDGSKQIGNGFLTFVTNGCAIGFIACKTSGGSVKQVETECGKLLVVPQYQFLPCGYRVRTRNKVQADVVDQLLKMI